MSARLVRSPGGAKYTLRTRHATDSVRVDLKQGLIQRGGLLNWISQPLEGTRVWIDGAHGRAFAPAKLLAIGVLGATKRTSSQWLVIDGPDYHWRVELDRKGDESASQFIEVVTNAQRETRPW